MKAFKFLAAGAVGRFSDVAWPLPSRQGPGWWLGTDGAVETCHAGVHACRLPRLVDWLDDELWEIELDGQIVDDGDLIVASRARLLGRVTAWRPETAMEFLAAVRDRASLVPDDTLAAEYAGDLPALSWGLRPDMSVPAVAEAVQPSTYGAIAANVAFVAAHAVALATGDEYDATFAAERAWQDAWLADHLGLVA